MPTYPVRRLGSAGIVPDAASADLENVSAFSAGVNVRFDTGRVRRAPVFREVATLTHAPRHLMAVPPTNSGYEEVISVSEDYGSILRVNGSTLENLTPPGQAPIVGNQSITSGFVGGVSYLNRETHDPLCKRPADDTFVPLPNWVAGDRCKALRPYKDQLVALGVTKLGTYYPNMVRWSDFAYFGQAPETWDPTDPTKSAGENIINGMTHPIVDGLAMRESFVIYCTASVWLMDYIGGDEIYQFRKLPFGERGIINPNCAIEVGGLHYVFDRNDIYVHDGQSTPKSIVEGRAKAFIFGSMDFTKIHHCFVQHDPKLTEVRFAYPGGDGLAGFTNPQTGCNRQAVYNYTNDTWTFYDAPNIVGGCQAALITGETWSSDTDVEWNNSGATWMTSSGDEDRHILVACRADPSQGLAASKVYGQDLVNGGRLQLPVALETLKPAVLERAGIDLDAYGKRLTQHVNIQAIWPQVRMDNWPDFTWEFGGTNFLGVLPTWSNPVTFDPSTETKIDVRESGKYLAYRVTCHGQEDFDLSGFDIQILVRGRR
jgi:hypothetical protein